VPEEPEMFPEAAWLRQLLRWQITSVELDPAAMRGPCPPEAPRELVRDGSNLAILVDRIAGTERFDWWVEHLRVSLPGVKHVNVAEQAHDRRLYLVVTYENGLKVPSWRLSDGTLRFLGLTLIPCLPPENRVFLVEEPENGIHPQAIELLMQSLTSVHEGQVLVATHSPIVVGVTDPADLLCFSQDDQRATHIEQGSQHPGLAVWKDNLTLADIFAAGILG
jgi:predicted ATPase